MAERNFLASRSQRVAIQRQSFIRQNMRSISPDNLIYDPTFLGFNRSPDFILIQVTTTVGNDRKSKLAFYRHVADGLKHRLSVRSDDITINMVYVDRSDWSFGGG